MSDLQMLFLFCVVYSGALSAVIWVSLLARKRVQTHLTNPEFRGPSPEKIKQGA